MTAKEFRESVSKFDRGFSRVSDGEGRLLEAIKRFERRLQKLAINSSEAGISKRHEVAKLCDHLKSAIKNAIGQWTEDLADRAPVKRFSASHEDQAIVIVFGKVNDGKTTFVNFLADELQRAGASVRHFELRDGEEIDLAEAFAVGATETTARIQGVEVDHRLVLVDTPGLHSVTVENHDLTKLYTDSADALLWVTPSSSPGQVQELCALKAEVDRRKPLVPLITKSDERVEDWCDSTESITAETRNKTQEVRKAQERDVLCRTQKLGLTVEIRDVISISVFAYERAGRTDDARAEAGIDNLYKCLVSLVDEATRYKVQKAEQAARKFVDDQVLKIIDERVKKCAQEVITRSDDSIRELASGRRQRLKDEVETNVLSQLSRIVDQHKDSKNKGLIADDLRAFCNRKLTEAVLGEFAGYVNGVAGAVWLLMAVPMTALSAGDLDDFEDVSFHFEQTKGAAGRSVSASLGSAGAAAAGAALGTAVFPGIGTVIGALLGGVGGGFAGDGIGSLFEHTEVVSEKVGVSTEALETSAHRALQRGIAKYVDSAIDALIETIRSTTAFAEEVNAEIDRFKKEVQGVE